MYSKHCSWSTDLNLCQVFMLRSVSHLPYNLAMKGKFKLMVNISTNIRKTNDHLSPQIIEHNYNTRLDDNVLHQHIQLDFIVLSNQIDGEMVHMIALNALVDHRFKLWSG